MNCTPEFKNLIVGTLMEEKQNCCEAARRFENLPAHSRDFSREFAGRKWSEMLIFLSFQLYA